MADEKVEPTDGWSEIAGESIKDDGSCDSLAKEVTRTVARRRGSQDGWEELWPLAERQAELEKAVDATPPSFPEYVAAYSKVKDKDKDTGFEILGELMEKSPAFRQYAGKLLSSSRPIIHKVPLSKARDWQLNFGPVSGPAGSTTTITVAPRCFFRGEKVMATDTGSTPGRGTRISQILVGRRLQRPAGSGAPFTAQVNQLSVKWDTCHPAFCISVGVSFVESCTFDMVLFGKAVI